jgi:hypothetical protein
MIFGKVISWYSNISRVLSAERNRDRNLCSELVSGVARVKSGNVGLYSTDIGLANLVQLSINKDSRDYHYSYEDAKSITTHSYKYEARIDR